MTNKINKITIVIPIHNEEKILKENVLAILAGLKEISEFSIEMLLIENGSSDSTKKIAEELQAEFNFIKVISLTEANYGAALKAGVLAATGDIVVNYDIDFWDCKFLAISAHIMNYRYDIVIASKNLLLSKDHRGLIRRTASSVFRLILFFVFGLQVSDTHGIKAWRNNERIRNFFRISYPSRHAFDTEVIIRAIRDNCEVLEIPVEVKESRISEQHIIKRVPRALYEITEIYLRLRQS